MKRNGTVSLQVVAAVGLLAIALLATSACAADAPRLLFSRLLAGVQMNATAGTLYIDTLMCHNLPQPTDPNKYYPYNADDGDKLWAILSSASGDELGRYDFTANKQDEDIWVLNPQRFTPLGSAAQSGATEAKLAPGKYVLDFHVAAGRFYSFPFEVTQVPSSNAGETHSYLEGDWSNWAYIYYQNADPTQPLVWKVFLRHKGPAYRADRKVEVEITRDADGKLIATYRPDVTRSLEARWVRHDLDLIHPMQGTGGGAYMTGGDLVGRDGGYTLKMKMDGQHYATWKFTVQGGKVVLAGRAAPEADPLTCVFGGADAWWCERVDAGTTPPPPTTTTTTQSEEIQIPFNRGMIPDATPITVNGQSLVPLRPIFQWLEADVKFDAATQTITATKGTRVVTLRVGSMSATIDGNPVQLEAPATSKEGTTYVPLRFVAEAFDVAVKWDPDKRLIYLIKGDRAGMIHVPK